MNESEIELLRQKMEKQAYVFQCDECKNNITMPYVYIHERLIEAFQLERETITHSCNCGSLKHSNTIQMAKFCVEMLNKTAKDNNIDISDIDNHIKDQLEQIFNDIVGCFTQDDKNTVEDTIDIKKVRCDNCTNDVQCEKCSKWEQEELARDSKHKFDENTMNKGK